MRYTKTNSSRYKWSGVFQHYASDPVGLQKRIAENVLRCLESESTLIDQNPKLQLYCGGYPPRCKNDVYSTVDCLIWKHSELTGKYVGCQYWSVKAKSLFDEEFPQHKEEPTMEDAMNLEQILQSTSGRKERLVHEHVFPKKYLCKKLPDDCGKPPNLQLIEELMNRLAIGCVVLQSEHPSHERVDGDFENPWLRYKGRLLLADNNNWPPFQRKLIEEAGLLSPSTLVLKTGN